MADKYMAKEMKRQTRPPTVAHGEIEAIGRGDDKTARTMEGIRKTSYGYRDRQRKARKEMQAKRVARMKVRRGGR